MPSTVWTKTCSHNIYEFWCLLKTHLHTLFHHCCVLNQTTITKFSLPSCWYTLKDRGLKYAALDYIWIWDTAAGGSVFSFLLRRVDLGREKRLYKQLLFSCSTNHWCWRSHHTSRLEAQRFHQRTWYCSSQTCRAGNLVICKYKMPALAIYGHSIRLFEEPEISKTMNIKESLLFFCLIMV